MNINQTMHPKAIIIFKLISLEPNQFYFLGLFFLIMVIFPKLDFQAGRWQLGECRNGIAWGVHRQPLQSTRGRSLDLAAKDIIGRLGRNPFFWIVHNIIPKDPSEIPLWLIAAHFIQYQVGFLATQKDWTTLKIYIWPNVM